MPKQASSKSKKDKSFAKKAAAAAATRDKFSKPDPKGRPTPRKTAKQVAGMGTVMPPKKKKK